MVMKSLVYEDLRKFRESEQKIGKLIEKLMRKLKKTI